MGKKTLILGFFAAFTAGTALGGTYTTISVDGDFADWVDVPVTAKKGGGPGGRPPRC